MEGIIDKENERARRFFALLDNMEKKVERLARDNRPPFNGERFLTDRELSGTLKISRRCLQDTGTKTDSLYPAWREDPVQAIGHREAAGGELSRCIGIISYSSLRIAAGIAFTIPTGNFYLACGFLAGRRLSSFHQPVHVRGYLPVGDLGVDLRAVDIRMAHHPGDALYRNARGQCQGPERMPGHVVGQVLFHA